MLLHPLPCSRPQRPHPRPSHRARHAREGEEVEGQTGGGRVRRRRTGRGLESRWSGAEQGGGG
eukprot:1061451-Rhodomonas_salina.1